MDVPADDSVTFISLCEKGHKLFKISYVLSSQTTLLLPMRTPMSVFTSWRPTKSAQYVSRRDKIRIDPTAQALNGSRLHAFFERVKQIAMSYQVFLAEVGFVHREWQYGPTSIRFLPS
jgi:hypothetical protein